MSRTAIAAAGGALAAAVGMCAFVVPVVVSSSALLGNQPKEAIKPVSCGAEATTQLVGRQTVKILGRSAAQVRNATTIIRVGQQMKIPPRGWVIAVATAMQESQLRVYANDNRAYPDVRRISLALPHEAVGHDHDSVGLFQQRPDEGEAARHSRKAWGPVKDLMDPATSARKFYGALVAVRGWQAMSLTRAAQRVQRSAYPNAYAKHEAEASRIVDTVADGAARTPATAPAAGRCAKVDEVTSSGWVLPVSAPVGSGFRTSDRPDHQGVDLSTRRGTPVRAAAAGTVVHMECDNQTAPWYSCNRDGSPSTPGCGWYLDIRHAGGIITRYCHMLRRPLVAAGDKVTAGQQIGQLGTSGHSSGPHLHFEVHTGNDRSSRSAINPVRFMRDRGAPLGDGKEEAVSA